MKNVLARQSMQVLENLTGIALGNGFTLPQGITRTEWVRNDLALNLKKQDKTIENFFHSLATHGKIRRYFILQLKRTRNPRALGICRDWKQTQIEALDAIINSFEKWYTRPLIEVPTGVGKSMLWGAIARAYYDTLKHFGLEHTFEIVIFTSRIHIGDQMIGLKEVHSEETDAPLEYGDVRIWLPELHDDDIRVFSKISSVAKSKKTNPKLTIACYQSLNEKTVARQYYKKTGLVLLDESHRVTDRVRIILENKMNTALFVGGSGTTKGPQTNNPFKFFEATKPERVNGKIVPYEERLTYHASITLCVARGELKRMRYINTETLIDLSSIVCTGKNLPEKKAAKFIAKNVPSMQSILEELFLADQPVLKVVGSKTPIERKWLIFVDRVEIAAKLTRFCNEILLPKLKKKYGARVLFHAGYVSGTQTTEKHGMSNAFFTYRMSQFETGEITVLFSSEKLGEGSDVPNINGILSFRAYGIESLWKFLQEVGRGTRFVEQEDLLVIDGVFKSNIHRLASLMPALNVTSVLAGGLIAGYEGERESETKVFTLLKEGLSWKQVWELLTSSEKQFVPFVKRFISRSKISGPERKDFHKVVSLKKIKFIEQNENSCRKTKKDFYPTWQEAAAVCQELGIKNYPEYRLKRRKDPRLPSSPSSSYPDYPGSQVFFKKVWKISSSISSVLFSWKYASKIVAQVRVKNFEQYQKKRSNFPHLPSNPRTFYSDYPGDDIFFRVPYLTWEEASDAAKRLGFIETNEYREKCNLLDPRLVPRPDSVYKNFPGYDIYLGREGFYKTVADASKAAVALGIKGSLNYKKLCKVDPKLPSSPQSVYKDFPGWKKFLDRFYITWQEAAISAQEIGIRSWSDYAVKYKVDSHLHSDPSKYYKDFPGWKKFLNTETYLTWQEAGSAAVKLGLLTQSQYYTKYKKDLRLPSSPHKQYPDFPGYKEFLKNS